MRELSLPDRCSGVTPVHGVPICGQSGRSAVVAGLERDLSDVGRARLLHLDIGSPDYLAPLDDLLLDLGPEFLLRVGYHIETKPFEARLHVRKIQGFDDLAVKQVLDFLRRCRLYQHRLKSIGLLALEPASSKVGTSRSAAARAFAATASARSLPSLTRGTTDGSELNKIGVWPAIVDCTAGAPPLHCTPTRSNAAESFKITAARWSVAPIP